MTLLASELQPNQEVSQTLTLQNTKSGTITIKYKWIKGAEVSTSSSPSLYKYSDYTSSSSSLTAPVGSKFHTQFGSCFKPCLPSEYILVTTNNDPIDKTYVGAFVGALSKNVVTVVYNKISGGLFDTCAEVFMDAFLKGLKNDATTGSGHFSVIYQCQNETLYNGNGKYKKVLSTYAKATVSGKLHQVLAVTCNLNDSIMLNFILMIPNETKPLAHFTTITSIAENSEAVTP